MLIIPHESWNMTHTDISKFFISSFSQLLDNKEVISNYYRSTNGLILLQELYSTSKIVLKRWKSNTRLQALIDEALDKDISSSVASDLIIQKYFKSIVKEISDWKKKKMDNKLVLEINQKSLAYIMTVKPKYLNYLEKEIRSIDLNSRKFDTIAQKINTLLNLFVSQLIHEGYSPSYLRTISKELVTCDVESFLEKFFEFFIERNPNDFMHVFLNQEGISTNSLLDHIPHYIFKKMDDDDHQEKFDFYISPQLDGPTFQQELKRLTTSADSLIIKTRGKDPFSSLGMSVIGAYRKYSIEEHGETNDKILSVFWEEPHYYNPLNKKIERLEFKNSNDPLILSCRSNTLSSSLAKYDHILEKLSKENLYLFEEAIYFYNLARAVPSVENSYILLWTSLESLMGLRNEKADIEIVKSNVAKSLALGSVGRRITALLERIKQTSEANNWSHVIPEFPLFDSSGLIEGLLWISDKSVIETESDPYNVLYKDPLLCRNYTFMNRKWEKNKDILNTIECSFKTISYQLDRLYSARNLIIHSAKFGNTDTNLWFYLEWYVGKLLAQSVILMNEYNDDVVDKDPRDIVFGCLQGQYESSLAYLNAHKDEMISYDHSSNSNIFRFPILCF